MSVRIDWNGFEPSEEIRALAEEAEENRVQALEIAKMQLPQGTDPESIRVQAQAVRKKNHAFIYREGTYIYVGNKTPEELASMLGVALKDVKKVYPN